MSAVALFHTPFFAIMSLCFDTITLLRRRRLLLADRCRSRLGCQVRFTADMDGAVITIPDEHDNLL